MSQNSNQALVHIENVNDKASAKFYLGKRVAYIYKAKNMSNNTKFKCLWGKVINTHGSIGGVRCSFKKNLPPSAMGALVRVMLYPNKVANNEGKSGQAKPAGKAKVDNSAIEEKFNKIFAEPVSSK